MKKWYYACEGESVGPFDFESFKNAIVEKKLGPMDLVFKLGDADWRPLKDWQEFSEMEVVTKTQNEVSNWTVFVERAGKQKKMGPLATSLVLELLNKGEFIPTDYIWKEGMSDWYQINTIKEFQQDIEKNAPEETWSEYSAAELLKNVKVKDSKQMQELTATISSVLTVTNKEVSSSKAEDIVWQKEELLRKRRELDDKMKKLFGDAAFAEDSGTVVNRTAGAQKSIDQIAEQLPISKLLREKGFVEPEAEVPADVNSLSIDEEPVSSGKIYEILNEPQFKESEADKDIIKVLIREASALFPKGSMLRVFALFFLCFAFSVIVLLSSHGDKEVVGEQKVIVKKEMINAERKQAKQIKQVEIRKAKSEAAAAQKRLENKKLAPTALQIIVKKEKGVGNVLSIYTDASKHFNALITFYGKAVGIVGGGGYYRELTLPINKKQIRLTLGRLKVPEGSISVKVQVGDLKKKKTFMNIEDPVAFKGKIKNRKKNISVWHQKEKRALYGTVKRLGQLNIQLSSLMPLQTKNKVRWERVYKNWKTKVRANSSQYLRNISTQVGDKYIYPKEWVELKILENKLLNIKKPMFDYRKFKSSIGQMESRVASLSLW